MNVVLVLPTYNEKGNIDKLIPLLQEEVFPQIKNHKLSILVVDDNSPDGTADEVRKLMKKWDNIELNTGEKQGLGAAYVRGMSYAIEHMKADVLFEMDSDFFHDFRKIPQFLERIDEGYDMVIGTRYSSGGSIPKNWGFHRKVFSVVGNLLVRTILMRFSIHDWTGGYRALKKEVFLKLKEDLRGFKGYTFQVAFLHKAVASGYKVAEVPFHAADRVLGRSKIAPLEYIINLLRYVIIARIFELKKFVKFLVVGGGGFIINAVTLYIGKEFFQLRPEVANLIGAALAIFSNFNFNNLWTFRESKVTSFSMYIWKLLHFYATSSFGVIFIQTGTIFIGNKLFGEDLYFLYFLIGTGFLLIWNFTIYNKFIWRKKPH